MCEPSPTTVEMFEQCPTDVVCVSVWPPGHLPVTLDALALPLTGILVEKPLADTSEDGRTLLNAVQQKDIPIAVPHGLLVADHSRLILGLVQGGAIGELVLAEIECSGLGHHQRRHPLAGFFRHADGARAGGVGDGSL